MKDEIRELFRKIPDGGSRNLKTPKIKFHDAFIPTNNVIFCRLTRAGTYNKRSQMHINNRYVLIKSYSGTGCIIIDGVKHPFKKGDVFLICPFQFHTYSDIKTENITWLFWAFNIDNSPDLTTYSKRSLPISKAADKLLYELAFDYRKTKPNNILKCNNFTLKAAIFLNSILEENKNKKPNPPKGTFDIIFNDVNTFITQNIHQNITSENIKDATGYSENHLRRLFKNHINQSLTKYIRSIRIKKSIMLLTTTKLSIKEIMGQCGFNSAPAFSKIFTELIGHSPKEYRQIYAPKNAAR